MKENINKFLLIDDNKATNFLNKTIIKKTFPFDYVLTAENGQEALNILQTGFDPEIIFLDINMPIMNGWEFLAHFKRLNLSSKIVIMIGEELTDDEYDILSNKYEIRNFNKKILDKDCLFDIVKFETV